MGAPLDLITVDDPAALAAEWSALLTRVPNATPFASPEWLLPWLDHIFEGGAVRFIAARAGGRLVALAPFFTFGPESTLAFAGAGISDYCDLLVEPAFAPAFASACLPTCSPCLFDDVPANSPLAALPSLEAAPAEPCPILTLPHAPLPRKFKTDLNRARNRFERSPDLTLETAASAQTGEYLDALFRLHTAAWQARGQQGVLAQASLQHFHCDVTRNFSKRGWLRFYGLRQSGALVAVVYAFHMHRRTYAYLGGFDPSLDKLSPGTLLTAYAIGQAAAEGATHFDFLRGRESYKYLWGAQDAPKLRLTCRSPCSSPGI